MTATHHLGPTTYTDVFVGHAPRASDRLAIEWARAILEGAPLAVRSGLTPGWALLGLDLASPHAPDHVLGWPIVSVTPTEVVLGARSRLGLDARLSIEVGAGPDRAADPDREADLYPTADRNTVRFRTAVRFEKRGARQLWTGVAPVHRLIVGSLLRHAVAAFD